MCLCPIHWLASYKFYYSGESKRCAKENLCERRQLWQQAAPSSLIRRLGAQASKKVPQSSLVGGFNPPEKYESIEMSVGIIMDNPKEGNLWNHQPAALTSSFELAFLGLVPPTGLGLAALHLTASCQVTHQRLAFLQAAPVRRLLRWALGFWVDSVDKRGSTDSTGKASRAVGVALPFSSPFLAFLAPPVRT